MSGSSVYGSLGRVRKPRVHITLEVETGGAEQLKELPFVVGVMGDFSGNPMVFEPDKKDPSKGTYKPATLKQLSERKFIQIDRDNFDKVLAGMTPGLSLEVKNTLDADPDATMKLDLAFKSIEDFDPARVAEQVPALKALLEARNKLRDLMVKADRSQELEGLLEKVLQDNAEFQALSSDLEQVKKD